MILEKKYVVKNIYIIYVFGCVEYLKYLKLKKNYNN